MIKNLPSASERQRIARFLLSGGTAALTDYATFLVMFYVLGTTIVVANVTSFLAGLVVSFLLNKKWVFKGGQAKSTRTQTVLYVSLAFLNLFITSIAIEYLHEIGVAAAIAKFILIGVVAVWNYFIFKKLIFKSSH